MTTDDAIEAIEKILDKHCPGTYSNGWKMVRFLNKAAGAIEEGIGDNMSCPS